MLNLIAPLEIQRPSVVRFGPGKVATVGQYATQQRCTRVLVLADAFNADRVKLLEIEGDTVVFARITAEPDTNVLEEALAVARRHDPDLVIGFGGGSAMDLAKLVAVLASVNGGIDEIVGVDRVGTRTIGLVQVPTTAGTGSEAGMRALVTDPQSQAKLAVESRHMLADMAVIDPDLMITIPPRVTAETGVDALAHCVESYTSRIAHPMVDIYALEGIRLIGRYLRRAVEDGADTEARAGMALAALYGGYCLGPVNTTAGHAVAYPLSTRHHVPHGAANAVIFPHVLAFNAGVEAERTAKILDALGLEAGEDGAHVFTVARDFCRSLGIEMDISNCGVRRDQINAMAFEAAGIRRLLDNNPRPMDARDIELIYQAAFLPLS